MPTDVLRERDDGTAELAPRLARSLKERTGIMRALIEIFVDDAKEAFAEQGMNGQKWPGRYPNQSEPFINVAGAITDLAKGPTIKARRFVRRPAGIDTGGLMNSIAGRIDGKRLIIGSPLEHAQRVNRGGMSRIPINGTVRTNLAKVMKSARKYVKRHKKAKRKVDNENRFRLVEGKKPRAVDAKYSAKLKQKTAILKLGFLFREKGTRGAERAALNVNVVARKFLGPSRDAMQDAREAIVHSIQAQK